jgi:hypothetical protein
MTDSLKSTELGGREYAPPEAVRLGNSGTGHGYDCGSNGSAAPSACIATGSTAQSCDTGLETGGSGDCNEGFGAANCKTGNAAFRNPPGCHTGNDVVPR